jgi:DNA helicase-2/ATP-dependent DNA helicase PcrA
MRNTLLPPLILSTPPDDPQPNPPDQPDKIYLHQAKLTPDRELEIIAKSVASWLPDNPNKTAAILVARNDRGAKIVDALNSLHIQPIELLRSSASTRQTADILAVILAHLSEPTVVRHLADLYSKLVQLETIRNKDVKLAERIVRYLRSSAQPERLIWPDNDQDWLLDIREQNDTEMLHELEWFCTLVRKWHQAAILSIDQLILTISQDLFSLPIDLALAHKIALSMEISADNHPDWLLPHFSEELQQIAENRRKFYGFSNEDTGFDPDEHKGKVVVTTMHKAKGLEWDRVYLVSVSNYDFPYGDPEDNYIGEKWYVKDKMNLEEETLAKLKALLEDDMISLNMEEGEATRQARIEYARERLRLFFVGVTRAKSELVITWNSGRSGNNHPSVPFQELMKFWNNHHVNS